MRILEMLLPRLELVARLASDREVAKDPLRMAQLREDHRYLASVCRNVLTDLEEEILDLPAPVGVDAPVEDLVAYQMAMTRKTNRLYRAVTAELERHAGRRQDPGEARG